MSLPTVITSDSFFGTALRYVGSFGCHEEAGGFQFELLRKNGLIPTARILEIGAGCLITGHKVIDFLNEGNYVAIEPNSWLIAAGREFFGVKKPFTHLTATNFDAGSGQFDIIYSHSILSHAGSRQLPQYLSAVKSQLRHGGVALASIRFNISPTGWQHHPGDSEDEGWDYPRISWFTRETVQRVAAECGVRVNERSDIREAFTAATNGEHHHDWLEIVPL